MENFIRCEHDSKIALESLRLNYEKVFDDLYDNFDIDLLFDFSNDILDVSQVGEYLFIFFVLILPSKVIEECNSRNLFNLFQ